MIEIALGIALGAAIVIAGIAGLLFITWLIVIIFDLG